MTDLDRPLGIQEFRASTFSRKSPNEVGKIVSPMNRPPLPPRYIAGTHFLNRLAEPER